MTGSFNNTEPRLAGRGGDKNLVDLTADVTVFVITIGGPCFVDCVDHIERQDSRFRLQVIDRVAPLSAALQLMLDCCATPLFVHIEEDMLLEPHAIGTLYDYIVRGGPEAALYVAPLWDAHVGRQMHGLRIFRHEVLRRYPFEDVQSSDIRQLRQLEEDGFRYIRTPLSADPKGEKPGDLCCGYYFARRMTNGVPLSPGVLGRHLAKWTPTLLYERYLTVEQKWQSGRFRLRWYPGCEIELLERFSEHPTEDNFLALMGIVVGTLTAGVPHGEKDFRTYDTLPGLQELRDFYRELAGSGNAASSCQEVTLPAAGENHRVVRI